MLALMTSSMKTNVNVPGADSDGGSSTNRGRLRGTFTRANLVRPPCCTATARFVLRLETNGNGCPGSNASGVSTGKTSREKYFRRWVWIFGVHSCGSRNTIRSSASWRRRLFHAAACSLSIS